MDRKIGMDLWIACVCAAIMGIACIYMEEGRERTWVLAVSTGLMLFFILLALAEKKLAEKRMVGSKRKQYSENGGDAGIISEMVLLSEENTELTVWDMYGKVSMVIGRDTGENQVDVDLNTSPYASMVEVEHAVLNFSAGNWYIEDLGSANGISVKKGQDEKIYRLSADTPCRLDAGDTLIIGMNHLLIR